MQNAPAQEHTGRRKDGPTGRRTSLTLCHLRGPPAVRDLQPGAPSRTGHADDRRSLVSPEILRDRSGGRQIGGVAGRADEPRQDWSVQVVSADSPSAPARGCFDLLVDLSLETL